MIQRRYKNDTLLIKFCEGSSLGLRVDRPFKMEGGWRVGLIISSFNFLMDRKLNQNELRYRVYVPNGLFSLEE